MLCLWAFLRSGWKYYGVIMLSKVIVSLIQQWLIIACFGNCCCQVVGTYPPGCTSIIPPCVFIGPYPVFELLASDGFNINQLTGPEDGDKYLRRNYFTSIPIYVMHLFPVKSAYVRSPALCSICIPVFNLLSYMR
jgi:hypothetical protein